MNVRTGQLPDDLDERLAAAAFQPGGEADDLSRALAALVERRAVESRSPRRKRKLLVPTAIVGGVIALLGTGAAVANQWAPWAVEADDPDIAFTREWYDVSGRYLGYCEGRIEVVHWDPDQVVAAQNYLATVDADALEPNLEWLAMALAGQGELDRIGDLVEGADPSAFEGMGSIVPQEKVPDADLLHNALMRTVLNDMHGAMDDPKLSATGDVQCSTDTPKADSQ